MLLTSVLLFALASSLATHAQTATWTETTQPTSPAFAPHDMTDDSQRGRLRLPWRVADKPHRFFRISVQPEIAMTHSRPHTQNPSSESHL